MVIGDLLRCKYTGVMLRVKDPRVGETTISCTLITSAWSNDGFVFIIKPVNKDEDYFKAGEGWYVYTKQVPHLEIITDDFIKELFE